MPHDLARTTQELVSVVIPTFNRADCLAQAVDSALAQTHAHLEVLIIDDGSTDGTAELVRRRWSPDPRVRYFAQPNRGLSAARNAALSLARGTYAAFLDSDDCWLPWKIEAQLACMARFPGAVLIHSDMDAVDARGALTEARCLRSLLPYHPDVSLAEIYGESCAMRELLDPVPPELREARVHFGDAYSHELLGNLMMPSASMARRDRAGNFVRFDETLRVEEAYDYFLRVCLSGPVAYLDAATCRYERGRQDHLWKPESAHPPEMVHQLSRSYLRVMESAVARDRGRFRFPRQLLARQLAGAHLAVADSAILVGKRSVAIGHFLRSLRLHPRQRRAWLMLVGGAVLPLRLLSSMRRAIGKIARRRKSGAHAGLAPGGS